MPAANLTELFDFEGQFEAAANAILGAVLVSAYTSGGNEQVPLLNTGISFDLGPAQDTPEQLTRPSNWSVNQAAPQEYHRYTGNLEFRIEVPRDNREPTVAGVTTMMAQIRGMLREQMMLCVMPFNDSNLPHYRVTDIRPNGASFGDGPRPNTDAAILRWVVTFHIKKTAWPAWVES